MRSPSHQNQIGTRCGAPSGRTVDSHTTGSSSRNRRIRALATVGLLHVRSVARSTIAA